MPRSSFAVLSLASLIAAAPAAAQPVAGTFGAASSTKGFFLGAHLNGTALSAEDLSDDTESGGGLGVQVGYGFTPRLALVLDGTGARFDVDGEEFTVAHFDVALRYAFTGQTRRFVPFLELGYSGRAAAQEDVTFFLDDGSTVTGDLELSGTGFTFGGGLQYYVSPKVAIGAGVKWTTGEFDTVKFDDVSVSDLGIDAMSARVNLGLTWYPMGGR